METSSIDGETNLKLRLAPTANHRSLAAFGDLTDSKLSLLHLISTRQFTLDAEQPNASVNTFSGVLNVPDLAAMSLSAENMLVRGSILRNTAFADGVAVYTGTDTKLVKNSRKAPSKLSNLDRLVNRAIKMILVALSLICTVGASVATFYNTQAWIDSSAYIFPIQVSKLESYIWFEDPHSPVSIENERRAGDGARRGEGSVVRVEWEHCVGVLDGVKGKQERRVAATAASSVHSNSYFLLLTPSIPDPIFTLPTA